MEISSSILPELNLMGSSGTRKQKQKDVSLFTASASARNIPQLPPPTLISTTASSSVLNSALLPPSNLSGLTFILNSMPELQGGGKIIVPKLVKDDSGRFLIEISSLIENLNTYFPDSSFDKTLILQYLQSLPRVASLEDILRGIHPVSNASDLSANMPTYLPRNNSAIKNFLTCSLIFLFHLIGEGPVFSPSVTITQFKTMVDAIGSNTSNRDIMIFLGLMYDHHATPELKTVIEDSLISGYLYGNEVRLSLFEDDGHTIFFLKDFPPDHLPPALRQKIYEKWLLTNLIGSKDGDTSTGFIFKNFRLLPKFALDELHAEIDFVFPRVEISKRHLSVEGAYLISIWHNLESLKNEQNPQNQRIIEEQNQIKDRLNRLNQNQDETERLNEEDIGRANFFSIAAIFGFRIHEFYNFTAADTSELFFFNRLEKPDPKIFARNLYTLALRNKESIGTSATPIERIVFSRINKEHCEQSMPSLVEYIILTKSHLLEMNQQQSDQLQ